MILVDDRSLGQLRPLAVAARPLRPGARPARPGRAKVVAFDLLFTEPEEPVPADLRGGGAMPPPRRSPAIAATGFGAALERLADSDRDDRFAAAMRTLRPCSAADRACRSVEAPGEGALRGSPQSAYARFDRSPLPPVFPLRPKSAVLPIETLAAAAGGLGHAELSPTIATARRATITSPCRSRPISCLPCRYA